ncbi:uncharacterized protein N7487_002259 [Penicillium crustosum]|uniref:uncharacterized protein n=1 Tax=Penicillium crustosum TaxID=36656 RepID=UPI002385E198|nr:uncharacterized protein N7487_002259 [Penicillium crustosum]KAJ5418709.1 hypothetical protein N7487_002259 [Penicillium crustosum]
MELDLIFHLVASTTATLCSVASLAFWLLYTEALSQGKRNKKQLIYSQIMIGGIIILGSVASMLLALKRTTADNVLDLLRSISAVEVGVVLLLLILNESFLTHMIAALFFVAGKSELDLTWKVSY